LKIPHLFYMSLLPWLALPSSSGRQASASAAPTPSPSTGMPAAGKEAGKVICQNADALRPCLSAANLHSTKADGLFLGWDSPHQAQTRQRTCTPFSDTKQYKTWSKIPLLNYLRALYPHPSLPP
uniref:Uncharacterized protein n=1 Tax=Aquila chrysaetos chrysaetos TaxID=223781 RepID=A0A663F891_AQUCH